MKLNYKKILMYSTNTIVIFLLLIGLLVAISLLPIKNNYKLYSVMSGSMKPSIPIGSLAIVVPSSTYQKGDIITFISHGAKSDEDTTTHRIASIAKDGNQLLFTTKGDANEDADAKPVLENRVVGKYIGGIALVGYLLKYLVTLPGLIGLIAIPTIIIIAEETNNIINEVKNIKKRRISLTLER